MSEAKHTPGPWRWELAQNAKRVQLCGGPPKSGFGRYDLTVMSFARFGMSGAAPVFWDWQGSVGNPRRADALGVTVEGREHHASWFQDLDHPDARLIAAAPDLLEALQLACIKLGRYRQQHPDTWVGGVEAEYQAVLKIAEAALSKALSSPKNQGDAETP